MITDEMLEEMSLISIENYLNPMGIVCKYTREYIKLNFDLAIKLLVINSKAIIEAKGNLVGINSINQGSQSISFSDNIEAICISNDIKMLLPKPFNFMTW